LSANILWLHDLRLSDLAQVGGKNSSLGEMIGNLAKLGVSVPGGFATTADAFKAFIAHNDLHQRIFDRLAPLDVAAVVGRVVTLEGARLIEIAAGPRVTVQGDSDQLEQLLINIVRNAIDAARETGGGVRVGWQRLPGASPPTLELWVDDEGPGLANTGNLFVPFFTTKPG
jgi:signal transduction histidine kinase